MAGWTTPALVAAVSAAGGLGTLASARATPAQLAADIDAVRLLTDRPFGVNFLLAPPEPGPVDARPMLAALNRVRTGLGLAPADGEWRSEGSTP